MSNAEALFICALVTVGCLFYIFYLPGEMYLGPEKTRLSYLRERKDAVYDNLRDLNFEYRAGKFPESDYAAMKNSLEEEAAAILAEIARLEEAAPTYIDPKGARA
jgi:hypothetical protein